MKVPLFLLLSSLCPLYAVEFPGASPGAAALVVEGTGWQLGNAALAAHFAPAGASWQLVRVDRLAGGGFSGGTDLFRIGLNGGTTISSSQMHVVGTVQQLPLTAVADSPRLAERLSGKALRIVFRDAAESLEVRWQAELRDGSAYLRQCVEIVSLSGSPTITDVTGLTGTLDAGAISGYTDGAVFSGTGFFAGLETPVAKLYIDPAAARDVGTWNPAAVATGTLLHDLGTTGPGPFQIKYQYTSGNHRLDMVKAELLDGNTVVSTDTHTGYTGNAASNNTYVLQAPERKNYKLRTTLQQTSGNDSNGRITLTEGAPALSIGNWTPALVTPKHMNFPVSFPAAGSWQVVFTYTSGNHRLDVTRVDLRDASNQIVSSDVHSGYAGVPSSLNTYTLNVPAAGSYTLSIDNTYPNSDTNSNGTITANPAGGPKNVRAVWPRGLALAPGDVWKTSSVVGLSEPGQARRSFLHYLERERAHPYRQFVHYNSWFDLNIGRNDNSNPLQRMTESQALAVVDAWNQQLYTARGVRLDGFVWDDGWDDFNSLWNFHVGFPNGFSAVNQRVANQQSGIGAWLSPWGGYGSAQTQRIAYWNSMHDPDIGSFHLSNAEYYGAFRDRCLQMAQDYDMRYFKFDGIGGGTFATGPGSGTAQDIDGLLKLAGELRDRRSDVFINCTVGTWASPFWLLSADSIWRQGYDTGFTGPGNNRERWITYRDEITWERFASSSPFYPLNSLMFHGLVVGNYPGTDPASMPLDPASVAHEIRCATACGSGLQELYVSAGLMTPAMWDELAKSLRWLRANADVLPDVHWVGGKPYDSASSTASVYGWAAWNPRKGTLALRNPGSQATTITLTLAQALELPAGAPASFAVRAGYADQRSITGISGATVASGASLTFDLQPYEVLVFDLWPAGSAIPDGPLSAALAGPSSFGQWAAAKGLTVSSSPGDRLAEVFVRDDDGNGITNGVEYALGLNGNQSPLNMRDTSTGKVAETPEPSVAATDSARCWVETSSDLANWSAATDQADALDKPAGVRWWRAEGNPDRAFFRVRAALK
ncbi:hypothetical protein KBB96_16685 [Luteolibacter ambystomatis]|uniref:Enterotoxin n=1 Tax=Luteolibacter ambystomatis TaxID=2824561 RepID=A0A975G6Z9_9BACT|nr:hypothetical protein [Luteolibacter ambystomatis]QUE50487.1 hypothetical protein KBB96_16685 [Luteolibacter ambystomatis]